MNTKVASDVSTATRSVPAARARSKAGTEALSLTQLALRRLVRNRVAMLAAVVLLVLHLMALFAEFVAPYGETASNRRKSFHPPTRIHIRDEEGRWTRPFVYNYTLQRLPDRPGRFYVEDRSKAYPIQFFAKGQPYKLLWLFPTDIHLFRVESPADIYLFGTDSTGRDLFSRIWFGARRSLFIGIIGIAISASIGVTYGMISGFFGGRIDNLMMRLAEVILAIPGFYLLVSLAAVLPLRLPSSQRFTIVVVVLSFIGWAGIARVIRGMTLSIREMEFIQGARAIGASNARILFRHILPNTLSYVIVAATLAVPGYILAESGLSLIGVGVQEPQASWGNMLRDATNITSLELYPWTLVPGVMIFLTVLCYSFFGDGVRDAFDPKARR